MPDPRPMQPQPKVPLTPGRFAFGMSCLSIATCGVLSPLSLVIALWSLRRPEPLGFAALALSAAMVVGWLAGLYIYSAPAWIPWLP